MRDDDQRAPGVSPEAAVARHDRRGWRLQSANRGPSVKSAHSYCTPDHLLNHTGQPPPRLGGGSVALGCSPSELEKP